MAKRHPVTLQQLPVWFLAALFACLCLLVWTIFFPHAAAQSTEMTVGSNVITLEIASTPQAQARGLGGRSSLAPDHGMLFPFANSGIHAFWMLDMRFPLDIIWLSHGTVVDVATLDPPVSSTAAIPSHTPSVNADAVLELNAGQASALGITIGSRVDIR